MAAGDRGQGAALLEVRALSLRRSGRPVLQDIAFQVHARSLVGVIGPNGAGKTSLLDTVAGFLPHHRGEVMFEGRPMPPDERRPHLFYLPDGIRPYLDHRAGDVLDLFRAAHDRTAAEVSRLTGALGIDGALATRARELSKGFAKRWLLVLAMLARAPLLLLDEPLDGLDVRQVAAVRVLFDRLRDEGRTLVLSIHELSLAERVCETFLLLAEGRLLAAGDLPALRSRASIERGGLDDVFLALT